MLTIEISINMEIALFIVLFLVTKQIGLYALFMLFVLIHELTHMIVGISLGFKPKKIIVMPFGFKIEFKEIEWNKKIELKNAIISFAGPLANVVILLIAAFLKLHTNIIYINLIITLFNLLPIYPLDGGRILKSILTVKLENKKVYKIVNRISNICIILITGLSSILILALKNIHIIWVIIYLWYVVIRENRKYKTIKRIYDVMETNK